MESDNSKLNISVFLAERKYMISVLPSEEAGVRKAADYINQQSKELASKYAFKDRQDILALISLMNTTKMQDFEKNLSFINEEFGNKVKEIEALVDVELEK